jgi:gliding motility-associated protein GldM
MAGGKVTVRQKMINMMYLVLTALLALNVSADILRAFHLVEVSMERAGVNIDKKNKATMAAIDKYVTTNKTDKKGLDAQANAAKVDKIAKNALVYLAYLKKTLVDGAGGRKEGKVDGEIEEAQNMEKHANLLIVKGEGAKLKAKINEWRKDMLGVLKPEQLAKVQSDLNTDVTAGSTQTWESELFEHSPVAAVITLLAKIENDVKNTESQVLEQLNSEITTADIIIDNFSAEVIPENGTYITQGGKYVAKIFLAASSSRSTFDLNVNGTPVKVENGIGMYETTGQGEGEKKFTAVITQKSLDGKVNTYKHEAAYTVVKPLAVVSATKMNVVYRGLENPISVSVPGYAASQTKVTSSLGSLKPAGQGGTFNLSIPVGDATKELVVSVSVQTPDGVKKMGEQKYRIKNIPKPVPMLGNFEGGEIAAAQLQSVQFVYTALKDFAFEGVNFSPIRYDIVYAPKKNDARIVSGNGPGLPPEAKSIFRGAKPGDRVILTNIRAQGPAGAVVVPQSVVLTIK